MFDVFNKTWPDLHFWKQLNSKIYKLDVGRILKKFRLLTGQHVCTAALWQPLAIIATGDGFKGFQRMRGDETTYIGMRMLGAGTAGESDRMGHYVKLSAQESQHLYGSTKHLRDSRGLLEASAIHSVVLLPQDTPCMAGCYGRPPALLPLLECLFAWREEGEERLSIEEKKEEKWVDGSGPNWQRGMRLGSAGPCTHGLLMASQTEHLTPILYSFSPETSTRQESHTLLLQATSPFNLSLATFVHPISTLMCETCEGGSVSAKTT